MWKRKILLEVLDPKTGEPLFYLDEHRMDFVYEGRGGGHIGDVCTINLYNLGKDLIKFFSDSGKDPYSGARNFTRVRLSAWHEDERDLDIVDQGLVEASAKSVVIDGFVYNVFGKRVLPEHILSLFVIPLQAVGFNSEVLSLTIKNEKTFTETVDIILEEMSRGGTKYTPEYDFSKGKLEELNSYPFTNKTWSGEYAFVLANLCDALNISFRLDGYKITFSTFKTVEEISEDVKEAEKENKFLGNVHTIWPINLRGLPQVGMAVFDCVVSLDLTMKSFDVIDVTNVIAANGDSETNAIANLHNGETIFYDDSVEVWAIYPTYMIKTFTHVGSNYTSTWETHIRSVVFRDSKSLLLRGMLVNAGESGVLRLTNRRIEE